ncbi:thioesterase family protein [uncultured Hyphomicrobium sp.]|uniref:thioesterase family protein n=1 Tax=uncultured Hyphomicrobium sp. TaxID=194373 RepID=UPI0025EE314A|nr:thioesterase family protein [uncultured Hyphomicrobium sp.]
MNLWLRLLWLFLTAPFRPRLAAPTDVSVLTLRVLPNDLDLSLHMNNGRYLAVMDLGRLDLLLRSGLGSAVWRNSWTPVANAAIIRFRRELRALDRFRLETRVVAWQEQAVLIEQRFVFAGGERDGQVSARALFKGALYDRKARRYVAVSEMMQEIGASIESPPLPEEFETFLAADRSMREAGRDANA